MGESGASRDDDPRTQGMRQLTRVALEGRYGKPLGDDILTAVSEADERTLTDVVGHLTTDMLIDLRHRLGLK